MEVTNDDGTKQVWMVEGGTPNTLLRRGLNRDTIPVGAMIVVDGYQSKDRTARANGRDVTFQDGSKFFMGSSGTGAPRDGRDSTEPEYPAIPNAWWFVAGRRERPGSKRFRSRALQRRERGLVADAVRTLLE